MSNYYLCPKPFGPKSDEDYQLGWAKEVIEQGTCYLRAQPAWRYIDEGIELVNSGFEKTKLQFLSDAHSELTIRNLKELVAAQTNLRIIPAFKTEQNQFLEQANLLNKAYISWQLGTFADRSLRKSWQYATAAGTGYAMMVWDSDYYFRGKGDIVLKALGPKDVLPVGMPNDHNLQRTYCVCVRIETPIHELLRKFPQKRDLIKPSRDNMKGKGTVMAQSVKYATAALRKFGLGSSPTEDQPTKPWATCDVYLLYIDDDSVNTTGRAILMGDPGTTWEYLVPYVGQSIPDPFRPGQIKTADEKDCQMYPNKRVIQFVEGCILEDDPFRQVNPYWHGNCPVAQFRADDWAWNFLGTPITRAGANLEKATVDILRGMVDSINGRLSPPRAYDRNTMAQSVAQALNTRIPNQVIGLDLSFAGEHQIKPLLDPAYYDVPAMIPEMVEMLKRDITHQMGVADASALARARQLPSGDSLEQLMEAMGPLIKDQSRNMEASIRDLGEMWKFTMFQFYTAQRRMQMFGPNGLIEEDFDFNPGSMVPNTIEGLENAPQYLRARHHAGQFAFQVTPYSLHEINSVTRKLFHLQLMRAGFPIDWWTLAELFEVRNFGPLPMVPDPDNPLQKKEATTVMEKWIAQQEIQIRFQVALQAEAQQQAAKSGLMPPPGAPPPGGAPGAAPPGAGPGKAAPPGANGIGHRPEGHPPSGTNPPSLEQKADMSSTIRESKK